MLTSVVHVHRNIGDPLLSELRSSTEFGEFADEATCSITSMNCIQKKLKITSSGPLNWETAFDTWRNTVVMSWTLTPRTERPVNCTSATSSKLLEHEFTSEHTVLYHEESFFTCRRLHSSYMSTEELGGNEWNIPPKRYHFQHHTCLCTKLAAFSSVLMIPSQAYCDVLSCWTGWKAVYRTRISLYSWVPSIRSLLSWDTISPDTWGNEEQQGIEFLYLNS